MSDERLTATPGMAWRDIAASAYRAYAASTGNKNFRGEPMPEFNALPQAIQTAWEAAVRQAGACLIDNHGDPPTAPVEQRWAGWIPPHLDPDWRPDGSAKPTTGPRDPGIGASPDEERPLARGATAPAPGGTAVNDENDFQGWLDEHPDDYVCRLVFADWLQERGDPRAEGYRCLGRLHRRPKQLADDCRGYYWTEMIHEYELAHHWIVPGDWLEKSDLPTPHGSGFYPRYFTAGDKPFSRRECEDAAALAFSRLPPERRAELLAARTVPV